MQEKEFIKIEETKKLIGLNCELEFGMPAQTIFSILSLKQMWKNTPKALNTMSMLYNL